MRRLEHVAAGVEHEVRRLDLLAGAAARPLPEPLQQVIGREHAREMRNVAVDLAEAVDAQPAPVLRFVLGARHGDARHHQQEARIDPVVAGLDALAAEHAGVGPVA